MMRCKNNRICISCDFSQLPCQFCRKTDFNCDL